MYEAKPRSSCGNYFQQAVIVQFYELAYDVQYFLQDINYSVEIPLVTAEWKVGTKHFTRNCLLMLSLAFNIHKY